MYIENDSVHFSPRDAATMLGGAYIEGDSELAQAIQGALSQATKEQMGIDTYGNGVEMILGELGTLRCVTLPANVFVLERLQELLALGEAAQARIGSEYNAEQRRKQRIEELHARRAKFGGRPPFLRLVESDEQNKKT